LVPYRKIEVQQSEKKRGQMETGNKNNSRWLLHSDFFPDYKNTLRKYKLRK
jgi:hypothetical protein